MKKQCRAAANAFNRNSAQCCETKMINISHHSAQLLSYSDLLLYICYITADSSPESPPKKSSNWLNFQNWWKTSIDKFWIVQNWPIQPNFTKNTEQSLWNKLESLNSYIAEILQQQYVSKHSSNWLNSQNWWKDQYISTKSSKTDQNNWIQSKNTE